MFTMSLDIDRLGERTEAVNANQPEFEEEFEDDYGLTIEDVEDVTGIFALIGDALEESNLVRFRVECFGSPWPVDVRTDLLTVLEQLSELLKFLNTPESTIGFLDFYEQGIERQLVFSKIEDNLVKLNCHKLLEYAGKQEQDWGQELEEEPIKLASLNLMICNLIKSFVAIADELCPTLTSHKFFQEWCREKYIADCLQNIKKSTT